ncbi:hypothetical protein HW142_003706, partial [Salmonella enterica]|nr:hypothetical protein [Salmonella enterica]
QIYSFSVFPAPAGINRLLADVKRKTSGVPRASGDKPTPANAQWLDLECSPRQRG